MLKIRLVDEDWLEALLCVICEAEADHGAGYDLEAYGEFAGVLSTRVTERLWAEGIEFERAYQQTVGNFVIVQSGPETERSRFDEILTEEAAAMQPEIEAHTKMLAAV